MKHIRSSESVLLRVSLWTFVGLLAYMPLHIFLSTWIGSTFGVLEVTRVLKDVLMVGGFGLLLPVIGYKKLVSLLKQEKLLWLIGAYGALTIALALLRSTDQDAELLGVVYNTRYFLFFVYGFLLAKSTDRNELRKYSLIAVFASALIVLVIGILQYTVIPNDAFKNFGYQRINGVLPAFFIDDKPDLERVMSTLRDPNSFGSYLIIIGSLALGALLYRPLQRKPALGYLALSIVCLWFTFSRSAWLGFMVMVLFCIALSTKHKLSKKQLQTSGVVVIAALVISSMLLISFRNTYFVQNVVFHADQATVLEDPNELRIRFWKESLTGIVSDPIGSGPGTAGLASIRNNVQGTELNENYYLQIASEVGITGLILFLFVLFAVAKRLLNLMAEDWLAHALLASFMGLLLTNFLVHIWSNEAVAYTWWGLCGVILSVGNSHNNKKPKR